MVHEMKEYQAKRPNGEVYRGVRVREHPTRKHGLHPDRYYLIRYWANGKTQNEGVGWASEGIKPSDARNRLIEIKASLKAGTYETPAEKKAREDAERKAKTEQREQEQRERITFGTFGSMFIIRRPKQPRGPKPCGGKTSIIERGLNR